MTQPGIVGTWKLISYRRTAADGSITHPQGESPLGRLSYDAAGRVSALLMRRTRPGAAIQSAGAIQSAEPSQLRGMVSGFIAYYGTYDVDPAGRTVAHHIEACLLPGWVGTSQLREFECEGNRLVLSARKTDATLRLEWEREA